MCSGVCSQCVVTNSSIGVSCGALQLGTAVQYNTAIGYAALYNNTAGNNTAIGYAALLSNTSGTNNVALGSEALDANTTADNNTAVG